MRCVRPDPVRLSFFFEMLPAFIHGARNSPAGEDYERILYSTSTPYADDDVDRVLEFARHQLGSTTERAPEGLWALLLPRSYPRYAAMDPPGTDFQAWSALVHFHDASYPLYHEDARNALAHLGYIIDEDRAYASYVEAVDDLKERVQAISVPESNWFLSRLFEVGLGCWVRPVSTGPSGRAECEGASVGTRASHFR